MTAQRVHSLFPLVETDSTTSRHILWYGMMSQLALTSKSTEKPSVLPIRTRQNQQQIMATHHAVESLLPLKVKYHINTMSSFRPKERDAKVIFLWSLTLVNINSKLNNLLRNSKWNDFTFAIDLAKFKHTLNLYHEENNMVHTYLLFYWCLSLHLQVTRYRLCTCPEPTQLRCM